MIFGFFFSETVFVYFMIKSVFSSLAISMGHKFALIEMETLFIISFTLKFIWRYFLAIWTPTIKILLISSIIPFFYIIVLVIVNYFFGSFDFSHPVFDIFLTPMSYLCLLHILIVPCFLEWFLVTIVRHNWLYPAYNLILQNYIDKQLKFFQIFGNAKISKHLRGSNPISFLKSIKNFYQNNKEFLNITAKKILSLDSNYSSMGLSSSTCRIFDKNDAKRFVLYITKKQYSLAKLLITFLVASIAV